MRANWSRERESMRRKAKSVRFLGSVEQNCTRKGKKKRNESKLVQRKGIHEEKGKKRTLFGFRRTKLHPERQKEKE